MNPTAPITVCVGTFGDQIWERLANERALPSAKRQSLRAEAVRWSHGTHLHAARNLAAAEATSKWLCFLDADDELDAGYLEAMTAVVSRIPDSVQALVQPSTLGVHPDGHEDLEPVLIPRKPLLEGNFMVIGTLIRTEQFHRLGGFHDWPIYEDWELWLRAWIDGAIFEAAQKAIYRAHVYDISRNKGPRTMQVDIYNRIKGLYAEAASVREHPSRHVPSRAVRRGNGQ
jgi:glycosyltransferase involved in cell wall biosynthesis